LSQKQAFSKKKVFAGLEAFFVPKMAQDTSIRGGGGKISPGGPKNLQGDSCPPTSRAYASKNATTQLVVLWKNNHKHIINILYYLKQMKQGLASTILGVSQ